MNSAAAPERVEHFLLAAFAERSSSPDPMRPKRWNYSYVAAAAVVLVALGIGVAAWNSLAPSTGPEVRSAVPAATPTSTSGGDPQEQTTVAQDKSVLPRPVRVHRSPKRNKPVETVAEPALTETEVATDFMPIGYVSSASLQDGGSVVRVELPRSTIVSMGFAVNMDRYGERVKADVLLGPEGLARAIRFVQ